MLENAGSEGLRFGTDFAEKMARGGNEHGFARGHVTLDLESKGGDRHRFAGHDPLFRSIDFPTAEDQGADAVRITEGKEPVTGDETNAGIAAAYGFVDLSDRREDRGHVKVGCIADFEAPSTAMKFNREHVQEQL